MVNTTGKSGYEIRADLLNQAQGLVEGNIQREFDAVYMHNDNFPNDKKSLPSRDIVVTDVIAIAKELNEFVTSQV